MKTSVADVGLRGQQSAPYTGNQRMGLARHESESRRIKPKLYDMPFYLFIYLSTCLSATPVQPGYRVTSSFRGDINKRRGETPRGKKSRANQRVRDVPVM